MKSSFHVTITVTVSRTSTDSSHCLTSWFSSNSHCGIVVWQVFPNRPTWIESHILPCVGSIGTDAISACEVSESARNQSNLHQCCNECVRERTLRCIFVSLSSSSTQASYAFDTCSVRLSSCRLAISTLEIWRSESNFRPTARSTRWRHSRSSMAYGFALA